MRSMGEWDSHSPSRPLRGLPSALWIKEYPRPPFAGMNVLLRSPVLMYRAGARSTTTCAQPTKPPETKRPHGPITSKLRARILIFEMSPIGLKHQNQQD